MGQKEYNIVIISAVLILSIEGRLPQLLTDTIQVPSKEDLLSHKKS